MTTQTARPATSRYDWVDIARGLAILLVIAFHTGSHLMETGRPVPEFYVGLSGFFAPFRIPMLFFLSGIFLPRSLDKGLYSHFSGKLRNIAWPYVIWLSIYALSVYDLGLLTQVATWKGGSYLWFMAFLFTFFMVAPFVARIGYLYVACYALAISMLMPDGTMFKERFFLLMAFFFLGGYVGENIGQFTKLLSDRRNLLLVPLTVGLAIVSGIYGAVRYVPAYAIIVVVSVFCILSVIYFLPRGRVTALLQFIGRNSLVFYVTHVPVMRVIQDTIFVNSSVQGWPLMLISLIAALVVAFGMNALQHRSKLVKALFSYPDWLPGAPQWAQRLVDEAGRPLRVVAATPKAGEAAQSPAAA